MTRKLNITEARQQLLSLPERLSPGETVEVVRHKKTVLKIIRPAEGAELNDPFLVFDQALSKLSPPRKKTPKDLAAHYKDYLYGKKE